MSTASPPALAEAREQFLALVEGVRPDLHRYAARMVGSAIEGEDIVQEALAKAFYALSQSPELPPLRPWLFRVTHNAAVDHLRRYERRHVTSMADPEAREMAEDEPGSDPAVLGAAVATFMALPVSQRSAVILKDVLGEPLEEVAAQLSTSVPAVKSLLARGRHALRALAANDAPSPAPLDEAQRALVRRYVSLFNQRDWAGVQALLLEECRLDLVSKSQRQGRAVGGYFGRYAQESGLLFRAGRCEGRAAIGVFREAPPDAPSLAYVILLEWEGERVSFIRDFRYVPYITEALEFIPDPEGDVSP
jgi:RNA polymerase sigma factor (sigma-70 family)